MTRVMRILKIVAFLLALLVLGLGVVYFVLNEEKPTGQPTPEADALAKKVMKATHQEAWAQTGAVQWNFGGRDQLLWDRNRNYARVKWNDIEVLVRLQDQTGMAKRGEKQVQGPEEALLVKQGYSRFINDSFWLNPFASLFDKTVTRSIHPTKDGTPGLLIAYAGGGVTPGDAYLWSLESDGTPKAWQIWASIVPIGGLRFTWEDWESLPTGAKVSGRHKGVFTLELTDIKGGKDWSELETEDPFAKLAPSSMAPASRPATTTATITP